MDKYNIDNEVWKDVKDYEGIYQVSNLGRIKSFIRCEGKILKGYVNEDGYIRIGLHKNRKRKIFMVHRIVAQQFLDKRKPKQEINHKNGDKQDNNVKNIEWVTPSENSFHAWNSGLHSRIRPVLQYDLKGNLVNRYKSGHEAMRETGVRQTHIWANCAGKYNTKTAGGYIWKFEV